MNETEKRYSFKVTFKKLGEVDEYIGHTTGDCEETARRAIIAGNLKNGCHVLKLERVDNELEGSV